MKGWGQACTLENDLHLHHRNGLEGQGILERVDEPRSEWESLAWRQTAPGRILSEAEPSSSFPTPGRSRKPVRSVGGTTVALGGERRVLQGHRERVVKVGALQDPCA